MPDNESLRALWWFWINDYKFGGRSSFESADSSSIFFAMMNEATEQRLTQFNSIIEHLEHCFRRLARSRSLAELNGAVDLLVVAARSRYVHRKAPAGQLSSAVHSAEWHSRKPEHRHLLGRPICDLAQAIVNDQDYTSMHDAVRDAVRDVRRQLRATGRSPS
jgi:hypothetical protein